ncbi:MAG TPA: hypothetical protein VM734_36835 [Kofleriaceae bacterium]|nr:hypothetical protein [Kofleriaceae bacterium]
MSLLIDRREVLRWMGRASAGAAALHLVGACGGDAGGDGDLALDAPPAPPLDGGGCRATTADVLGPYHRDGAPARMMIASATEPGERLVLDGVVVADDCTTPLVGAMLDVWQADRDGTYYEPDAAGSEPFRLRGKLAAAADGTWAVDTIRPGNYQQGPGLWRPAHVHVIVSHPGYRSVTTQLYFAGDPYLPPNDSCTTCGSDDPDRILALTPGIAGGWHGEIRIVLQRA